MKVLYYFTYLLFSTLNVDIYTRNVYDSDVKLRENRGLKSYPVKRNAQSYHQSDGINPHEEEFDLDLTDQSNQRNRRIDAFSFRSLNEERDSDRLHGDGIYKRATKEQPSKEPYGLVYRRGKLLGVLEPYPEFYELSNANDAADELQLRRGDHVSSLTDEIDDSEKDEASQSEYARYTNDKYPSVFTSFKIDKKLNALNKLDGTSLSEKLKMKHTKRDKYSSDYSGDSKVIQKKNIFHLGKQKTKSESTGTRSTIAEYSDKVGAIEDDLRKILDDMGLVEEDYMKEDKTVNKEDGLTKREARNEDENLEEGSNKINIVKATNDFKIGRRKKREEITVNKADLSLGGKSTATIAEDAHKSDLNKKKGFVSSDIQNYQSEGDWFVRNKRNEAAKNNDIMKGLERSGELTVSGNKSPLASSESESKVNEKRTNFGAELTKNEYEKKLEENIQQKINAIKEEVKREIASLQEKTESKANEAKNTKRKKRNTLLDDEPKVLNPQEHIDSLLPYVRTKRSSTNINLHKRSKRNLGDFSNFDYGTDMDNLQDSSLNENTDSDYSLKEKRSLNNDMLEKKSVSNDYSLEKPDSLLDTSEEDQLTDDKLENSDDSVKTNDEELFKLLSSGDNLTGDKMESLETGFKTDHKRNKRLFGGKKSKKKKLHGSDSLKSVDTNLANSFGSILQENYGSDFLKSESSFKEDKSKEQEGEKKIEESSTLSSDDHLDVSVNVDSTAASSERAEVDVGNDLGLLNMQRKRRHVDVFQNSPGATHLRRKRGGAVMLDGNMAYLPFRPEEEEVDDESDEFDDDGFDDRSASLNKREINNQDYDSSVDYESANRYTASKGFPSKKYIPNLNSDVYEHSLQDLVANNNHALYDPNSYVRRKRHNFDQMVAVHGGGPMLRHISAVRDRGMRHADDNARGRRDYKPPSKVAENAKDQQNAIFSDTDLFGALPQRYEGELARYKRVKRDGSQPSKEDQAT